MVPLTMPSTRRIGSPRRLSRSGPDERDAAGDGRLEQQVDGRPSSAAANSSAPTLASSSLLAVTTGLPCLERVEDELAGRLDAADHLDHDVDVGIVDHGGGVAGEHPGGAARRPRSRARLRTATRRTSRRRPVRRLDGVGLLRRSAGRRPRRRCRSPARPMRTTVARTSGVADGLAHGERGPAARRLSPRLGDPAVGASSEAPAEPRTSSAEQVVVVSRRTTRRAAPSATNTTAGRGTGCSCEPMACP